MAYHEQHERKCRFCREWMSATAPKCLNCGRYVDEEDDDDADEAKSGPPTLSRGYLIGLIAVLIGIGVAVYVVRHRQAEQQVAADADQRARAAEAQKLHQVLGRMGGRANLNTSSPVSLEEVKPHLRVGMSFDEVGQLVSRKNAGPEQSTVIGTLPLPADDGNPEAVRQAYIVYLRDANLIIETDQKSEVVSWRKEPIK